MARLDGKVAIVTGGGGLLGAAFSEALAREGAAVLVNDLDGDRAARVVERVTTSGGRATACVGSVDSWANGETIVTAAVEAFGRVDCLVNGAHAYATAPIAEMQEDVFRRTIESHVTGHFACTHYAVRQMLAQGEGGSVVNLLSRAMQGLRTFSAYGAAKGAILAATYSWALELARDGIRVNALSPAARRREPGEAVSLRMPWRREAGQTRADMQAATPTPESVAPMVVYLASNASDWVSGQAFFLAGDSLALIDRPAEARFAFRPEGWSVDDLEHHVRHVLGPGMAHPSMQAAPYAWHAGVGKEGST